MALLIENSSVIMKDRRSLTRCYNLKNPSTATAAIQAIAEARDRRTNSDDKDHNGFQLKFVVSKKELKQMLTSMEHEQSNKYRPTVAALEQLLHVLKKKQIKKVEFEDKLCSSRWRPALQSIPEEIY